MRRLNYYWREVEAIGRGYKKKEKKDRPSLAIFLTLRTANKEEA
jgi:hypothetical protein